MYKQASLGIAKIAVLASLLFISNAAYAQDAPKKWQHGFGAHALRISDLPLSGLPRLNGYTVLLEYAPRREWDNWSLDVGIGRGLRDRRIIFNHVPSNTIKLDYEVIEVDAYGSISGLYKLTDRVSMGPAYTYYRYSLHGPNSNLRHTNTEVHFKLSVRGKKRKESFVILFGADSSSLGWRTYL